MRRVARRLFTLCWALSLLLCVASLALLLRSFFVLDQITWGVGGRFARFGSDVRGAGVRHPRRAGLAGGP